MPTSLPLTLAIGFLGRATGTATNAAVKAKLYRRSLVSFSGSDKQVLDLYQQEIAASGSLDIDLTTGQTNPLGESIASASAFDKVFAVFVEHDSGSSSSGITVMGGASDEFQGPFAAGDKATLAPGRWIAFGQLSSLTGWTVDATHKRIDIDNLDGANAADVNVFVLGTIA